MSKVQKVEQEYQVVGRWAREIVAKRVGILGGLATGLNLVVVILNQAGVHVPDGLPNKITVIVTGVLNALALAVGVLWARAGTTPANPVISPVSSNGQPLLEPAAITQVLLASADNQSGLDELDKAADAVLADADLPTA